MIYEQYYNNNGRKGGCPKIPVGEEYSLRNAFKKLTSTGGYKEVR